MVRLITKVREMLMRLFVCLCLILVHLLVVIEDRTCKNNSCILLRKTHVHTRYCKFISGPPLKSPATSNFGATSSTKYHTFTQGLPEHNKLIPILIKNTRKIIEKSFTTFTQFRGVLEILGGSNSWVIF